MSTTSRIPVHAKRLDPGIESLCSTSWSCQLSTYISEIWLLIAIGLAVGLVFAALVYLRDAKSSLVEEQSRTAAEERAFRQFADRVANIRTSPGANPGHSINGGVSAIVTSQLPSGSLESVREAYRDTVMAVPHYEEEYDESMVESMAIELGEDIAKSVSNGRELSPLLQQALVSKAIRAATDRESLMGALDREGKSLYQTEDTFSEVQSTLSKYNPYELRKEPFETLELRWDELGNLERRCEETLEARQGHLRGEPLERYAKDDRPTLAEYLYQSLDVDYPVLATVAEFLDQIETSRQTISHIVSSRN